MEQVRTSAPLEPEIKARSLCGPPLRDAATVSRGASPQPAPALALPLALILSLLPASPASAHNGEFLLAKATPLAGGRVALELTLDYGNHPLIHSEVEARAALSNLLQIQCADRPFELSALAPLRFERRTEVDPGCPLPSDPATDQQSHALLTALWEWEPRPAPESVRFLLPKGSPHTVVLWTPPEKEQKTRWVMLLGGDQSPPVLLSKRGLHWRALFMCSAAVAVLLWIARRRTATRKRESTA